MGDFAAGERALFLDRKGRRYLVQLRAGAQFHTHSGFIDHDAVIGGAEGSRVVTSGGSAFTVVRPTLVDFILKMPRGAQVVYPKDVGAIVITADVHPGATVLEAGTGSGALTLGMLRAVGDAGRVITYEVRQEFADRARANIEAFFGKLPDALDMRFGDVTMADLGEPVDRIVLDLPEPWTVVEVARRWLRPGGIFCCYLPTVLQVGQATEALRTAGFIDIATTETLVRTWHVEGQSIRPDHRMVAHTGFITTARLLAPDAPSGQS
ncbi:MAG: tRNA (adenine-N1)-methyltransferase [Actinomycetota bacterium]|nr:tRNA (adenine-N1)-methyltransferase [Actinomycetota bacterium]